MALNHPNVGQPTLLVITPLSGGEGPILTQFSGRGITMSLEQMTGSSQSTIVLGSLIRETVNGETINLIPTWMQKYQGTITCTDVETPCLDGVWLGQLVEIQCINELSYITGGTPQRPEVSGSSRVWVNPYTSVSITYYRPIIIAMITAIRDSIQEYQAAYQWQLDYREQINPNNHP